MKNLISTLIISSIVSAHALANHKLSDLRIRNFDNRPVVVTLNQINYTAPGTSVTINDIAPGRHHLQVWTERNFKSPYHSQGVLLYNGFIDVPAASEVRAMVTRSRSLHINKIIPLFNPPVPVPPYYSPYPSPFTPICGTPVPLCMHEADFNALLSTIEHQSFESTRLTLARQAIRQRGAINTNQVAALLNTMNFESSRLELAKFAYPYTVDQGNYFNLFNAFSFDSSVRELSAFMDSRS